MSNQKEKDSMRDEGLKGNEQIEEAILEHCSRGIVAAALYT